MRSFLIIFAALTLMFALPAQAEKATPAEMEQVCQNWLTYIVDQEGSWYGSTTPTIAHTAPIMVDGAMLGTFYTISPMGHVVVPVLKEMPPVKAYSDDCTLDITEAGGPALLIREKLGNRANQFVERYGSLDAIQPVRGEQLFTNEHRRLWDYLTLPADEFMGAGGVPELDSRTEVGPLLLSFWHQGAPYNMYCPEGDGGQCVVGCVATAAAQIMKYWEWPPIGEGTSSYTWDGDQSCGGDFGGGMLLTNHEDEYDWDNIPNSAYTSSPEIVKQATAEINYEVGVMFEMDYGRCGSGAYGSDAIEGFPAHFHYKDQLWTVRRINHTAETWFQAIQDEINLGRPMLYHVPGHLIVCDGWRDTGGQNQYHMNYGWGGQYNTWFTIDNLHIGDPDEEDFIKGIEPDLRVHVLKEDGSGDFTTIQGAVDAADPHDWIVLRDGTYLGAGNRDIDPAGKNLRFMSMSLDPSLCTIDCQGSAGDPHRGFYFGTGETTDTALRCLTITGGYTGAGLTGGDLGGGILSMGATPILEDCVLQGNTAGAGGGLAVDGAALTITDCEFHANTAAGAGGALHLANGSDVSISGTIFADNSADLGGAVSCDASSPTILETTIAVNSGTTEAAGIYCTNASAPDINKTILAFGTLGAALYCEGAGNAPTLACTDVYGNLGGDWVGCIADQQETGDNLNVDPLFCDLDNRDFTLQSISLCAWQNNPECSSIGARYVGCEPSGEAACCTDFNCQILSYEDCEALSGDFLPGETVSDPNPCYPPGSDLTGGTLICHSPTTVAYSPGLDWCQKYYDEFQLNDSQDQQPFLTSAGDTKVWYVIGGWDGARNFCGFEFGFDDYETTLFYFQEWGNCGIAGTEVPMGGWPGPNTGTVLGYSDTMSGDLVPIYWFAGYSYYSGQIPLTVNANSGFGGFQNCLSPAHSFDATCFGVMGINTDGVECHPDGEPQPWACCVGLDCYVLTIEDCALAGGEWQGEGVTCDPDPCYDPQDIDTTPEMVTRLALGRNLPNPFASQTTISFAVPNALANSPASLRVYDATGALVRTLHDGPVTAGHHVTTWDGRNETGQQVGTGVYFYELNIAKEHLTEQMIIVR